MGILASLLTGPIINAFLGTALKAFEAYENKTITKEQLQAQLEEALLATFASVETAWAESYAKSYAAFITGAAQSKILAWGWLVVIMAQLVVLLWAQVGVPALVYFTGSHWPSAGTTVDYAYFLIAALFGAGALMLKPKAPDWKAIIGK